MSVNKTSLCWFCCIDRLSLCTGHKARMSYSRNPYLSIMETRSTSGRDGWRHRSAGNSLEGYQSGAERKPRRRGRRDRAEEWSELDHELLRAHRVANDSVEPEDLDWLCRGFSAFLASGGNCRSSVACGCRRTSARCAAPAATTGCAAPGCCSRARRRRGGGPKCSPRRCTASRSRSGHAGHRWTKLRPKPASWKSRSSRLSGLTNAFRERRCNCTTLRATVAQLVSVCGSARREAPAAPMSTSGAFA